MTKIANASSTRRPSLRRVRNAYDQDAEEKKLALIAAAEKAPPRTAAALMRLHEDLLFIAAFPGDLKSLRAARAALAKTQVWVRRLPKAARARLDDSGVAGSASRHVFPYAIAKWIAARARGEAEIDWRRIEESPAFDAVLRAIARRAEIDAFECGNYDARGWTALARPKDKRSDLQWIMDESAAALTGAQADELWSMAEPPIAWRLQASKWSTTRNILPKAPVVLRKSLRRPPPDPARRIAEPLSGIVRLGRRRAKEVIDVARAALSARCREVVAISNPNPDEVYWCDLGEGVALAVIGVAPSSRLSLETNTGYILISNGVPIGYGGVTPLYRQANTGINIFDPFRGGEASYLWVEMLRAFATIYGVKRFIVNGYQFGEGNTEAIASGAYWFYYRLGFRPDAAARRKRAAREAARLAKPNAERSDKATLKALAQGDLVLDLPGFDARDAFPEAQLATVSACASRALASAGADRKSAAKALGRGVAEKLGVVLDSLTPEERRAFTALAPIVSLAPDIGTWSGGEKEAVVGMMRAKGRRIERDFAQAAARNERLFRLLARLRIAEAG